MTAAGMKTRKPTGRVPWPCILLEGEEKAGKAQPLHARIATPTGWTTMGQVSVGDWVVGADGCPTTVLAVHERGERPVYRLAFSDGATVEACDEHLWAVHTANDRHRQRNSQRTPRPWRVLTTAEVRERALDGQVLHVPMTAPVNYAAGGVLSLDPYVLGLLLGDGSLTKTTPTFTSADTELFDRLEGALPDGDELNRYANRITAAVVGRSTATILGDLGLLGADSFAKFIPQPYLLASVEDRLALLQGLMDTDGCAERKSTTYCTVSPQLAAGVRQIVESLGGTASARAKVSSYQNAAEQRVVGKTAQILTVRLPDGVCPFRLSRKVKTWTATRPSFSCPPRRTIRSVDFIGHQPVRCITVAAEDHLYLTDHFVVTHNSWSLAEFSASDKIGALYWIDLNEGAADEYGAIPGADYQVVEHDGSYAQVLAAVQAVKAEARRASDAGEPPVVLGIDTGSAIWDGLKDWASDRAAKSSRNRELLKRDPNAEITISQNLWNDAGARWRKLQTELLTFPGIAVVTARGKEVTEVDANGRPIEGRKTWSVQTHKEFPYAATVWVRLRRGQRPQVIGARSVHVGIKPNDDPSVEVPKQAAGRLLEWLVFDALRCQPGEAHSRELVPFHGGELLDHEKPPAEERPTNGQPRQGRSRQDRSSPPEQQRPQQQRPAPQPPTLDELLAHAQNAPTEGALNQIANTAVAVLSEEDVAQVRDVVLARRAELREPAGRQ